MTFGDMLGKNSCIVRTHRYCMPAVTTPMMFMLMIFIDISDSCYCRGSNTRFDRNPNRDPVL